jgi:hypothetical protein
MFGIIYYTIQHIQELILIELHLNLSSNYFSVQDDK